MLKILNISTGAARDYSFIHTIGYGCSNVAKLFEEYIYIFNKKICMIFTKTLLSSVKIFFFFNEIIDLKRNICTPFQQI